MICNLRNISFFLLAIGLWAQGIAQDTIPIRGVNQITALAVDAKQNMFIADDGFTLYKADANGEILTNVNTKIYGAITKIDCTNPFEIYTYHTDQNVVVFYDNMLNIRGQLRLNDHYFNNISCIARSFDNGIWLFDLSEFRLLKIDKAGQIVNSSNNLINVTGKQLKVFDIQELGNNVYLVDSALGVLKFDFFATYSTTYYIEGLQSAAINPLGFWASTNNTTLQYYFIDRGYDIVEIMLNEGGVAAYQNKTLYTFFKSSVIRFAD
jgi:hypothetical protein